MDEHEHEPQEQQQEDLLVDTHSPSSFDPASKDPHADVEKLPSDETQDPIENSTETTTEQHDSKESSSKVADVSVDRDYEQDAEDFDDFGSTTETEAVATATANPANDDFGDFGDFGTTTNEHVAPGEGNDEDDDGFGDFGEVQAAGEGEDDFGDFNDFAEGDGFQNADGGDDFGDFGGNDAFGSPETGPVESAAPAVAPVVEEAPVETAPDFNAVNSRQVENYVLEKLSALYPVDQTSEISSPQLLNPDLEDLDVASVLSDQELWTSLCEQSFQGGNSHNSSNGLVSKSASQAPQFQWKYSDLRKEYYASLGMVIVKEQSAMAPSSIPNSITTPSSRSRVSSPMIVGTETMAERKPLDIAATQAFCQFTPENLGGYSGDEMKDIIAQLTELTRQASDELTYWLDQREQMIMDSEKFNEMIASLVGHAAKLKTQESKMNTKTKRLTRTSFHLK